MTRPCIDAPVSDQAPTQDGLTDYDRLHLATYLRLLDAAQDGADWGAVTRAILGIDPTRDPERARRAYDSHLARARWMTETGYRHILVDDPLRDVSNSS
jgi:hypothetical protein